MRHTLVLAAAVLLAIPAARADLPLDVTKHGLVYRVPGMDAVKVAARLGDKVKDPPYLTARATCELLGGDKAAAEKTIAAVVASGSNAGVLHYNLACALALAGKRDDALDHLERSVAAGWSDATHMSQDPDLTSLRETPRYKALLAKMQARKP